MITLHVEAPTYRELLAKALIALGAVDRPAPVTESAPAATHAPGTQTTSAKDQSQVVGPAPDGAATSNGADAGADPIVEPPKQKNKGGRKRQTDITSASEPQGEDRSAQPAVASNTGSDPAGTSPPAEDAVSAAGAEKKEDSQPAADVTPEQLHTALNEVAALDGGQGIRHVVTMLNRVGGYRKVREITDQIHRNRLMTVVKKVLANKEDFIANPGLYMDQLAA